MCDTCFVLVFWEATDASQIKSAFTEFFFAACSDDPERIFCTIFKINVGNTWEKNHKTDELTPSQSIKTWRKRDKEAEMSMPLVHIKQAP